MMNHVSNDMTSKMTRVARATMSPCAMSAPRPYGFSTTVSDMDRFPLLRRVYLIVNAIKIRLRNRTTVSILQFPNDRNADRRLDRLTVLGCRQHALAAHALQTGVIQARETGALLNALIDDASVRGDRQFDDAAALLVGALRGVGIVFLADMQRVLWILADVGMRVLDRRNNGGR